MFMRSGIYVLFLFSVAIGWFMKRQKESAPSEKRKNDEQRLAEIEIDNPHDTLKSLDWTTRLKAVQMLSNLSAEEAIPSLIIALDDEDADVRDAAADALAAYDELAVPHLLVALKESQANGREMALDALAGIGGDEALQGIAQALLTDESAWIRIPAAEVLGETGDERYIEVLVQALQDNHQDVYEAVSQALRHIGTKAAIRAIAEHPYTDSALTKKEID